MVAPLVAAAVRAAAAQAVRQAAAQAAKQAARATVKELSKEITAKGLRGAVKSGFSGIDDKVISQAVNRSIAQSARRYTNAAERYVRMADEVGERTRYGQLYKKAAARLERKAAETLSFRGKSAFNDDGSASTRLSDLLTDSEKYLSKAARGRDARGDLLGETLLDGTMQGHRLFAITRDLWEGGAENYAARFEQLKEAFGGKNLSEIILEIEKDTKINIMKGDINSKERYGNLTTEDMARLSNYIRERYAQ